MGISESQKILLAKLYYRDSVRYREKLEELGIAENVIDDYIIREKDRRRAVREVKIPVFPTISKPSPKIIKAFQFGAPNNAINKSVSQHKGTKSEKSRKSHRVLVVVDGDNHPYENMNGYHNVKKRKNVTIEIFVANENLKEGYLRKFNINAKLVQSGDQAVDNRIKTLVGDKAKNHVYDKIVIISHDKGYQDNIKIWKQKHKSIDIITRHDFTKI